MSNENEIRITLTLLDVSILDELYPAPAYETHHGELVEVKTLATAKKRVPGAAIYAPVAEGFLVFPTMPDYLNYCHATGQLTVKHLAAL